MAMTNYATKEVLKMDASFKKKIQGLNEKILWKVGDDISYLTTIKNGKVEGDFITADVTADDATLVFEISDATAALKVLSGAEVGDFAKNVKVSDMKKATQLAFMTTTVGEYLKDLRAKGG
jgi:hypothetical protein